MILGYYKYKLKSVILDSWFNMKLRLKGHNIGSGCHLRMTKFTGLTSIRDDVSIGEGVWLGVNITIGRAAKISRLTIGDNSHIESGVICTGYGSGKISMGKECYVGINNILDWSDDITIGDFVQIAGPSTALWTHSGAPMCINSIPLDQKGKRFRPTKPIVIGSNVYIGGNCTIYPGVTIGHHSIVAPNSAVTKDVPPFSLVGGVPARMIKKINDEV